jgi:hypothetical protein
MVCECPLCCCVPLLVCCSYNYILAVDVILFTIFLALYLTAKVATTVGIMMLVLIGLGLLNMPWEFYLCVCKRLNCCRWHASYNRITSIEPIKGTTRMHGE